MTGKPVIKKHFLLLFFFFALLSVECFAQRTDSLPSPLVLKKLTLEELMNIEVMSVSKRPEKLNNAASAIQVITKADIINSGAKTIPEALRLAPNLQVAQVNASQWAISARGFNNVLANKLLVLIDGRTVYTPLYAGVFWDVQNLLLEDVDRIEVISGPGGTLWGANAVNGVINIITKSTADTKGLFVEAAGGTDLKGQGSLRYGGQIAKDLSYRVYGTGFNLDNTLLTNGRHADDNWYMLQTGFRMDYSPSATNKFSVQGNIYHGKPNPDGGDTAVIANGNNLVFRWNHSKSAKSDFQLQGYYDYTLRDFGNGFTERLKTYDLDWQNRYRLGQKHDWTYGLNFRAMDHEVANLKLFQYSPGKKTLYLYSIFLQDEIMLLKDHLYFTPGIKIEHNSYTGFEYQPSARISWNATKTQTLWGSVSRAVRTPSRTDRDFYLYLTPTLPFIAGNAISKSEDMLAYELGWRLQPVSNLSLSLSTFYNEYDNIRSAEPGPPPFGIPLTFGNGVKGKTYGMELAATYQPASWWNLRGGYTFLKKELHVKPGSRDLNKGSAESDDPMHQFLLQSSMDMNGIIFGTVIRYIDKLPKPKVPAYWGLDLRVAWSLGKGVELSITGQNLLDNRHPEFIPSNPTPREIERSVYGKIICRL